jgi:hypothetical protein
MVVDKLEVFKAVPVSLFLFALIPFVSQLAHLRRREGALIGLAFLIRACLAIVLAYKGFDLYGDDPIKYDYYAYSFASGHFQFDGSLNVFCHSWVGAIIYFIFGHSSAVWAVINSFVGALTIIFIIKIINQLYGNDESKIGAQIYNVFPSYIFFAATIHRETVVMFLIAIAILMFIKFLKKSSWKYFIKYIITVIIIALFRPLNSLIFFGIAFPFVILRIYNANWHKEYTLLKPIVLSLFITMMIFLIYIVSMTPLGNVIINKIAEENLVSVANARTSGESAYLTDLRYSSFWSINYYMPIKFMYFTFGPFPWMAQGIAGLAAALEGVSNMIFFILSWRGFNHLKSKHFELAYFIILFPLICLAAQGAIDSNFGTALRHRISFTFIFLMISTYSLARSRGIFCVLFRKLFFSWRLTLSSGLLFLAATFLFNLTNAMAQTTLNKTIPYEDEHTRIWASSAMESIDRVYDFNSTVREFKNVVELFSAKNEYESFQVILSNKSKSNLELKDINLRILVWSILHRLLLTGKILKYFMWDT